MTSTMLPLKVELDCLTDPFGCVAEGVTDWTAAGARTALDAFVLILLEPVRLDYDDPSFRAVFDDVATLSAVVVLLLMLVSLLSSVLRLDPRSALGSIAGVAQWGVALTAGLVLAQLVLVTSDEMAGWIAGGSEQEIGRIGRRFADLMVGKVGLTPDGSAAARGAFWLLVLDLLVLVAVLVTLLMLALRAGALALLAVSLPLMLAGRAGPRSAQAWLAKGTQAYLALCLAKPVVVLALRLSLVLLGSPGTPSLVGLFTGLMLLVLAGFSPYGLYRFFGFIEPPAFRGVSGGGVVRSVGSSAATVDLARTVFRLNGPAPGGEGTARASDLLLTSLPFRSSTGGGSGGSGAASRLVESPSPGRSRLPERPTAPPPRRAGSGSDRGPTDDA
jgi:hypothetical protein